MGIESIAHQPLGNTVKGVSPIVIVSNENAYSYTDWLREEIADIKDDIHETNRHIAASHSRTINKLCENSVTFSPIIKSMEYFSQLDNLTSDRRQSRKLMMTKNPVAFGAQVYANTRKIIASFGAQVYYCAPNEFIGLEFATKGLLVKNKFNVNYDSDVCVEYADNSKRKINNLNSLIRDINLMLSCFNNEVLEASYEMVSDAISRVLDAYHICIGYSVKTGLAYTAIEDVWLNKKVDQSRIFAAKLLSLYEYAEKYNVEYNTAYPSYDKGIAEKLVSKELTQSNYVENALYSEVFENIMAKYIKSSTNEKYQLGYLIPQNTYIDRLSHDLSAFHGRLKSIGSLEEINRMVNV